MANAIAGGQFTCAATPVAVTIACGFVPDLIMLLHEDLDRVDHWCSMNAAGTATSVTTAAAAVATLGITAWSGSSTVGSGFTVGTGCQEAGKKVFWTAQRVISE